MLVYEGGTSLCDGVRRPLGNGLVVAVDGELFGDPLPTFLTRFVGRDRECAALAFCLDDARVVTVCGVGGAGKTRLALEVAKRVRSQRTSLEASIEVVWVSLADVVDPGDVGPAMATALGLSGPAASYSAALLARVVGSSHVLLVLDNCEQVRAACGSMVAELVESCPGLTVLATSRLPLALSAEVVYPIPPLGSVGEQSDPYANDATALFMDRAQTVAPAYRMTDLNARIVADICRTLSGLPLAIELAASWIRVLAPRDLLSHLSETSTKLVTDAPHVDERHRSIQAVLDNSWQWLAEAQRSVLAALGVFVGGFTPAAASAVSGADLATLAYLAELSLIQRVPETSGGTRFHVHELVRAYAVERLERPAEIRDRHVSYFLDVIESRSWGTPVEPLWSDPLGADLANIEAAAAWAMKRQDAEAAQRLAVALDHFFLFCFPSEARRLAVLEESLALPSRVDSTSALGARAQALQRCGLRLISTNPQRSIEKLEEGAGLFEQLGDSAGLALCISSRGNARMLLGDLVGARSDCLQGVARSTAAGDRQAAAWALESAGAAALLAQNWEAAVDELSRAADDFAERSTPLGACRSLFELSIAHQMRGDWIAAVDACKRALQHERDYRLVAEWADIIDVVARLSGELRHFRTAAQLHGASAGWRAAYETVSYAPQMRSFLQPDRIRRQLGQRAWTDPYVAGGRLDMEEATELAVAVLDDLRKEVDLSSTGLSRRQIEVLCLVAEGLGDAEIANRLMLSRRTVQAHLRSIYQKLNVTSRTAAVRAAHAIPGMSVVD